MGKLIIFTSLYNKYDGHLIKFKNEFNGEVLIINIEEYKIDEYEISASDIVYFCTNSCLTFEVIKLLEKIRCKIINKEYLLNNYSKLDVQEILNLNKILVPKIYLSNANNINYPVYIKENKHEGIVKRCLNDLQVKDFLKEHFINEYYLEEEIKGIEKKIYFVRNKTFNNNEIDEYNILCNKISKLLSIEVFSIDLITTSFNKIHVIDFNCAPGFYLLDEAREYFLNDMVGY